MKRMLWVVSATLAAVMVMSVYVTPAAASQGSDRGKKDTAKQEIYYLDAKVKVVDGQPVLRYETEGGYTDTPFEFPAYAISADGQEVAVKREGDAILLPTEDGLEAVSLKDFCAVMIGGQIMLLAEVNPLWKFPIAKAAVIAALKKAGVPVTTASLNAGVRLMLAGVKVTKTSVSVGKALIRAGVSITKTTVNAGKILRAAGMPINRANVDRVVRAIPIIRDRLERAGRFFRNEAVVNWLLGVCIVPWCIQPARQRTSFDPALMTCVHFPRHPCAPR